MTFYILSGLVLVVVILVGFYLLWKFKLRGMLYDSLNLKLLRVTLPQQADKKDFSAEGGSTSGWKQEINISEQLFGVLAGIGKPFVFESAVQNIGRDIKFFISVPASSVQFTINKIEGLWRDARVEAGEEFNIFNPEGEAMGLYIKQKRNYSLPIRTYIESNVDTFVPILSGLSRVNEIGEGAMIQMIVKPASKSEKKSINRNLSFLKKGEAPEELFGTGIKGLKSALKTKSKEDKEQKQIDEEAVKALQSKLSKPLFEVNYRVLASAQNSYQAKDILGAIASSFSQFTSPLKNELAVSVPRDQKKIIFDASFRRFNDNQAIVLNSEEMASLFHFPSSSTTISNVEWVKAKESAPPVNLPKSGTPLGSTFFHGERRPVFITDEDRRRHVYVVGQTGTGKSTFISNVAADDIRKGKGVAIIDPHGDLIDYLLSVIPPERKDDIIVFDPGDYQYPVGLNMLEYSFDRPEEKTFIVNEMQSIFNKLFSQETMGPMFEQYMRNALLLLMEDAPNEPATLVEVPRIFTDSEYRKRKLARISNPTVIDFWEKEASKVGGEASLANMTPYITSKFNNFISNDYMRPIIGQYKSAFNFRKIMDEGKILMVNLSKGRIGDLNANLLGMVITGKILMAALSRVDVQEKQRRDFYLYIDEFQNFTTDSIAIILSEARKYRLSLVFAHQFIAQLEDKIREAVFGNVGTIVAFRVGAEDTEILKRQFEPEFSENDLLNIDNFNAYVKTLINGLTAKPFNIKINPSEEGNADYAAQIKELSRQKYSRDRQEVEADILRRLRQ